MIAPHVTLVVNSTIPWKRVAYRTKAPKAYDGFGTATILTHCDWTHGERTVLIDPEHLEWQMQRYASGMFACVPSDIDEQELSRLLCDVLTAGLATVYTP